MSFSVKRKICIYDIAHMWIFCDRCRAYKLTVPTFPHSSTRSDSVYFQTHPFPFQFSTSSTHVLCETVMTAFYMQHKHITNIEQGGEDELAAQFVGFWQKQAKRDRAGHDFSDEWCGPEHSHQPKNTPTAGLLMGHNGGKKYGYCQ